jgi:aldehyde:ferredoxin oxidoreductase
MRKHLHINLNDRSVTKQIVDGKDLAYGGRHLIARTLLEREVAKVDPMSPQNPLIFSAGVFAGSNFSNANRISIGCKSPLTGGVKEANAGGTFAFAMGQLECSGLTLDGAADEWLVIRIIDGGDVSFEQAAPYMGRGNFKAAEMLFAAYGNKVSLGICGPVGEYGGLIAGIAFTDPEGRPVRIAARGGVGAVMGSKKIKALVIDKRKMPTFHDRKKLMTAVRTYGAKLEKDPAIKNLSERGTANVADVTNHLGGLPVRNFSQGRLVDSTKEPLMVGGEFIRRQQLDRGGETTHACMPGCMIRCSNSYVDAHGKEVVSPLEYETIGLLGTNCGLSEPDDIARLNGIANDLGIDTIETGALLGVMMDHGLAKFGDIAFMETALADIAAGNQRGRLLAQGTARVGAHYGAKRVPVIKGQAISAYDPRVIEVTGISMMLTAQGADHTTGNVVAAECDGKDTSELTHLSMASQVGRAAGDSLGICVFGRSVTDVNLDLIIGAVNNALGSNFETSFIDRLGLETLELEDRFNAAAGFTEADDELPEFFFKESLEPTGKTARHRAVETNRAKRAWLANVR